MISVLLEQDDVLLPTNDSPSSLVADEYPMEVKEFRDVLDVMRVVVRVNWILQRSMHVVMKWNENTRKNGEDDL